MRWCVFFLLPILVSRGLRADDSVPGEDNGKRAMVAFCKSIRDDDQRYNQLCSEAALRAKFYDAPTVISLCKTMYFEYSKVHCVDRARNSRFEPGAMDVCVEIPTDGFSGDSRKLDCLKRIAKTGTETEFSQSYLFTDWWDQVKLGAQRLCRKWDKAVFSNPNWLDDNCVEYKRGTWCESVKVSCSRLVPANRPTVDIWGSVH